MSEGYTSAFAGSWEALKPPLSPWILDVIHAQGFSQMTPVQANTIPRFMAHKDVVVEAVTGSGKTMAFVIPILEKLTRRPNPLRPSEIGALVISPTRELASQIHQIFNLFLTTYSETHEESPKAKLRLPLLVVAGTESSPAEDVSRFLEQGSDIVVGTPGRLEEFLLGKGSAAISVKELEVLVFDEADRLLDLGFTKTIARILEHLPKQRRTGLFSATMTDGLSEIVRLGLRNPVRIVVKVEAKRLAGTKRKADEALEERRVPSSLQNYFISCKASEKLLQLFRILEKERKEKGCSKFIVYFATCAGVDYFYRVFSRLPALSQYTLYSLHGHLPPPKRSKALGDFACNPSTTVSPSILLCTDVAARGLDLPEIDAVIQFDPPTDVKNFSHRAGRTARMGKVGRAWVLLVGKERDYIDLLSVRKIPVKEQPYQGQNELIEGEAEDPEVSNLLEEIRSIVMEDRDLHEKATKAFVSFVRAYSKHEASYIFRIKDLDLIGLARGVYGLLRLPKMPELKTCATLSEWKDATLDWTAYAYAEKAREKKRQEGLGESQMRNQEEEKHMQLASLREQKKKNAAWSNKTLSKEVKEQRKIKRSRKKAWLNSQPGESKETKEVEWDELAREERAAKKAKKGAAMDVDEFRNL